MDESVHSYLLEEYDGPTQNVRNFCMFVMKALISGFHSHDFINFRGNENVINPILKKTFL